MNITMKGVDFSICLTGLSGVVHNVGRDLYRYPLMLVYIVFGVLVLAAGICFNIYRRDLYKSNNSNGSLYFRKFGAFLEKVTVIFPLSILKKKIKSKLSFLLINDQALSLISCSAVLIMITAGIMLVYIMKNVGQLWYIKFLIAFMGAFLPYQTMSLSIDLYKYHVEKQIPRMIDEFRGAFIKYQKVKPALRECCVYIDKGLGAIITRAVDSAFMENNLLVLKTRFGNVWFNIFITLLINFKQNGGELIDQLYRLNRTMMRYSNVEKKKNKRLIWYELFAVCSTIFSIPAIIWLNHSVLGLSKDTVIDPSSNMIIGRLIIYAMVSMLVVRILRRM